MTACIAPGWVTILLAIGGLLMLISDLAREHARRRH